MVLVVVAKLVAIINVSLLDQFVATGPVNLVKTAVLVLKIVVVPVVNLVKMANVNLSVAIVIPSNIAWAQFAKIVLLCASQGLNMMETLGLPPLDLN